MGTTCMGEKNMMDVTEKHLTKENRKPLWQNKKTDIEDCNRKEISFLPLGV